MMRHGPEPSEECHECGKIIGDTEWVDNWGSCDECFNKHLEAFPIVPLPGPYFTT